MHILINTTDDSSTSGKNLLNLGPVTSEFVSMFVPDELHAGLCHALLVADVYYFTKEILK